MSERSLTGRVAVVTGVSRRAGIGFSVARRLLADGASVLIHSWSAHDKKQSWGADPGGSAAVIDALGGLGRRLRHIEADLSLEDAPRLVIDCARSEFGAVDALIANHAHSSAGRLESVTPAELDFAWVVNARAVVLLVKAYAANHDDARGDGRIVLFTSGQHLAPMAEELAYAISTGRHRRGRPLARLPRERLDYGPGDRRGGRLPALTRAAVGSSSGFSWGKPHASGCACS